MTVSKTKDLTLLNMNRDFIFVHQLRKYMVYLKDGIFVTLKSISNSKNGKFSQEYSFDFVGLYNENFTLSGSSWSKVVVSDGIVMLDSLNDNISDINWDMIPSEWMSYNLFDSNLFDEPTKKYITVPDKFFCQ